MQFAFIVCPSRGPLKCIETKVLTSDFTSYEALLKTKGGLELVSLPHFLHDLNILRTIRTLKELFPALPII